MYSTIYYKRNWGEKVSVSSRSYILSYVFKLKNNKKRVVKEFPSPLGVIFSLIFMNISNSISIILIIVSVSSRSYILSYCQKQLIATNLLYMVSVSSRSYILSYNPNGLGLSMLGLKGFRLLSELYSLL